MSSLLNKAKDAMGGKSGGGSSTGGSGAGQQSGMEKGISGQAHTRKSSLPLSIITTDPTRHGQLTDISASQRSTTSPTRPAWATSTTTRSTSSPTARSTTRSPAVLAASKRHRGRKERRGPEFRCGGLMEAMRLRYGILTTYLPVKWY